jgi:isopentenyldiphosphate isomerase
MTMADQIDVYNANLEHEGVMDRKEAHYAGRWHRTFHCWVVNLKPEPTMLYQLRAPRMKNYPNMLDVSAAGHIEAGESVHDGVREVHEELGIKATVAQTIYLGERVEVADQANGQRNREYQSVYLLVADLVLADYKPDPHEVWGLFQVKVSDGLDLFSARKDQVETQGIHYDESSKTYVEQTRIITSSDFIPRIQRYYLAALIAAERALEGKQDFAIS